MMQSPCIIAFLMGDCMSVTMLYQTGGEHVLDAIGAPNVGFKYIIVNDDDVKDKLAEGWFLTTGEAIAATKPAKK